MSEPRKDRSCPVALLIIVGMGLLLIAGFNTLIILVRTWMGS